MLLGRSSGFQVSSTPSTKGMWLWSVPIKRTALDGTEYNLLLLDMEGLLPEQGTCRTQFCLAVLLSSMLLFNQMHHRDLIDGLSLVAEMTSGGRTTTASELGRFSPTFVCVLRDFYLSLVEDNHELTPREYYMENCLRHVKGGDGPRNQIRESIRDLFPDRECFCLVRPVTNEKDLMRLDQIQLNNLKPEFNCGVNALKSFVFERARPKQLGLSFMTGPILARITLVFLDCCNEGAVPTITTIWKTVEDSVCKRAYEVAIDTYNSYPEGSVADQKAVAAFNAIAVGGGLNRQKYAKKLQNYITKQKSEDNDDDREKAGEASMENYRRHATAWVTKCKKIGVFLHLKLCTLAQCVHRREAGDEQAADDETSCE